MPAMPLPDATVAYDRRMLRLTMTTLLNMRALWGHLGSGDWDVAWRTLGPQLAAVMIASQIAAGRQAGSYVDAAVAELNLTAGTDGVVSPTGLAGVASDGRPLASLLYEPIVAARIAGVAQGLSTPDALAVGRMHLDRIVTTQVADAGRAAESVAAVTQRGASGWVRMANVPCCQRCAVLAGRFYRWSSGFERHPGDDCRSIPASEDVAGDLTTDPRKLIESGQVHDLSEADRKAIVEDGADPAQVINAHRGMSTAQVYGKRVKITSEGVTRHGLAGGRIGAGNVRLRPESIYQFAKGDRTEALRLLRRFGYIT